MPSDWNNLGLFDQFTMLTPVSSLIDELAEQRKLEERQRKIRSQELFIELYSRQKDELIEIADAERAFFNEAWPNDAKASREAQKLPTHNINMFLPEVLKMVGAELKNRREIRLVPVERDDSQHTELYDIILKHISRANQDWYYEQKLFQQGVTGKRAHQELYWDYADDPLGELKCVNRPPSEVLRDVDATDLNSLYGDSTVRIHMEWLTIRELTRRYKDKEIDYSSLVYLNPDERQDSNRIGRQGSYDYPCDQYPEYFWKADRRWVRLIRVWQRDTKEVFRVLDLNPEVENPDQVFIDDFDSEREAEKEILQTGLSGRDSRYMVIQKVQVPYWSYHVISGRAELEWKPDIGRFCPWIDFYAIDMGSKITGLWDIIEDRQHYINYTASKLTERVGRSGQPTVWRENSFVDDINPSLAIRDGKVILVKGEVWDKLGGQAPFHTVPDRSLESIAPLLNWVQEMKGDIVAMSNSGLVPAGASSGGVTAASALAILGQEQEKGTSSYGQNLLFARALKSYLRLWMVYQKYRETPTLIRWKLDKIFGSVANDENSSRNIKQLLLSKMLNGGIDYDALMKGVRTFKYDVALDVNGSSMLEKQQILQALQLAAQFGVQPSPKTILNALPLDNHIKQELERGVEEKEQQIQEKLASPEGQMQLQVEGNLQKKSKDGNMMLSSASEIANPATALASTSI